MSEVLNTDLLNNFNTILKATNDIFLKVNKVVDKFQVKLGNLTESSTKLEKNVKDLDKAFGKLAENRLKSEKELGKSADALEKVFSKLANNKDKKDSKDDKGDKSSKDDKDDKDDKSSEKDKKKDKDDKDDKSSKKDKKKDKDDKEDKSSKKDKKKDDKDDKKKDKKKDDSGFFDGMSKKMDGLNKVVNKVINNGLNKSQKFVSDVSIGMSKYGEVLVGVTDVATQLGASQDVMNGLAIATQQYNDVAAAVVPVIELWTAAEEILALIRSANPIQLIVMGIMALIAVITWVAQNTEGWGEAWGHVMAAARLSIEFLVEKSKVLLLGFVNYFMEAFDNIKIAYYEFKEALGLGDSGENQKAIANINKDVEARKKALEAGEKKVAAIGTKVQTELKAAVNAVHFKEKKPKLDEPNTELVKKNAGKYQEFGEAIAPTSKKEGKKEGKPKVDTSKVCACPEDKKLAKPPVTNNYITITINELMGIKANVINECKDSAKKAGTHVADELLKVLVKAKTATV